MIKSAAAQELWFEEVMMFDKRTIVAALMIVCSSVSVALTDGGTIKGVAKWEGKLYTQRPLPGVVGADPYCTLRFF